MNGGVPPAGFSNIQEPTGGDTTVRQEGLSDRDMPGLTYPTSFTARAASANLSRTILGQTKTFHHSRLPREIRQQRILLGSPSSLRKKNYVGLNAPVFASVPGEDRICADACCNERDVVVVIDARRRRIGTTATTVCRFAVVAIASGAG